MLSVEHLKRPGLEAVSFHIASGECIALTGPSGAGKTLLARAIADLDVNEGKVFVDGTSRESMPAPEWRRAVAFVPAESGWWAERVGDHFENPQAAGDLLAALGLKPAALDWRVGRLSTGERQRLALARALALSPKALLLDEPTSGLDAAATGQVEALLGERLSHGASILLVSHDDEQARRMAARRYRIVNGRLGKVMP